MSNAKDKPARPALAQLLIENKVISEAQVDMAIADQDMVGMSFDEVLLMRGWVNKETLAKYKATATAAATAAAPAAAPAGAPSKGASKPETARTETAKPEAGKPEPAKSAAGTSKAEPSKPAPQASPAKTATAAPTPPPPELTPSSTPQGKRLTTTEAQDESVFSQNLAAYRSLIEKILGKGWE